MKGHGSLSFKTNNEGHQEELFWANTMGGSGDNMYGYQNEYGGNLFIPLTIYKHYVMSIIYVQPQLQT